MREQRAIEVALRRRSGMSAERKEQVEVFNNAQNDWFTFCECGKQRFGTIEQLKGPCTCPIGPSSHDSQG